VAVLQQLLSAAAASVASGAVMHTKEVFEALAPQTSAVAAAAAVPGSSSSAPAAAEVCWGTADLAGAWKSLVVLLLQWGCMVQQQQQQQEQVCSVDGTAASGGAHQSALMLLASAVPRKTCWLDSCRLPLTLRATGLLC